jgi:hypothetical protein
MSASRKAETAKVMTIAVSVSACGSGSLISSTPPAPKNGAMPGRPMTTSRNRLVALPSSRKPISTRVRLRSSIA